MISGTKTKRRQVSQRAPAPTHDPAPSVKRARVSGAEGGCSSSDEVSSQFTNAPLPFPAPGKSADRAAREELPSVETEIIDALAKHDVLFLRGAPGSNKTTQLPRILYKAGYSMPLQQVIPLTPVSVVSLHLPSDRRRGVPGIIGVAQPRRVAVIAAAQSMAMELGPPELCGSGCVVGYHLQDGTSTVNAHTRVKFMANSVLLHELVADPMLRRYSVVVLDEAHERSVSTDVLVGLLSRALPLRNSLARREALACKPSVDTVSTGSALAAAAQMSGSGDSAAVQLSPLKLVIMSAAEDGFDAYAMLFRRPAPILRLAARQFPVSLHFARRTELQDYVGEAMRKAVKVHTRLPEGGLLVFLADREEVEDLVGRLKKRFDPRRWLEGATAASPPPLSAKPEDAKDEEDDCAAGPVCVLPLHSFLSPAEQLLVFQPSPPGHRLIVVATSVAETSVAIPGIRYVVDAGRVKRRVFDPHSGAARFEVVWICQDAAEMRARTAGCGGPGGHCYRLFSSGVFSELFLLHETPEADRVPLCSLLLAMKATGIGSGADRFPLARFPFPSPPPPAMLHAALQSLTGLGAIVQRLRPAELASDALTPRGRAMSTLPLHPPLACVLALAAQQQQRQGVGRVVNVGVRAESSTLMEFAVAFVACIASDSPLYVSPDCRAAAETAFADFRIPHLERSGYLTALLAYVKYTQALADEAVGNEFSQKHLLRPEIMRSISRVRCSLTQGLACWPQAGVEPAVTRTGNSLICDGSDAAEAGTTTEAPVMVEAAVPATSSARNFRLFCMRLGHLSRDTACMLQRLEQICLGGGIDGLGNNSCVPRDPVLLTERAAAEARSLSFVERILKQDMLPEEKLLAAQSKLLGCGDLLRRPLPLDTSSCRGTVLLSQLVHTVGSDASVFLHTIMECLNSDPQGARIVCAAAASGLGKTHLAYAAGKDGVYSIVIRVALQGERLGGKPKLAAPWRLLDKALVLFQEPSQCAESLEQFVFVAEQASKVLELLVYCYVDASLTALEQSQRLGARSAPQLREMLLRFNRNGTAESIVADLFTSRLDEFARTMPLAYVRRSPIKLRCVDASRLSLFRDQLRVRAAALPTDMNSICTLLLCFDEANALFGLHEYLFVRQAVHTPSSNNTGSAAAAVDPIPAVQDGDGAADKLHLRNSSRGVMYALFCLLCDLSTKCHWAQFVTGTEFSLAKFTTSANYISPIRGKMKVFSPTVQLTAQHMKNLLRYYWNLPKGLLEENSVLEILNSCEGRPLLFMDVVFQTIFGLVEGRTAVAKSEDPSCTNVLTVSKVVKALEFAQRETARAFADRFDYLLSESGSKKLWIGTGETSQVFVPLLVEAVLFGNGKLNLGYGDVLADAISSSLAPAIAVSGNSNSATSILDLSAEPLVFQALTDTLDRLIESDVNGIVRLFVPPSRPLHGSPAGIAAEKIVAIDFALRTRQARLHGRRMTLDELLLPMFLGPEGTFPEGLENIFCRAERVFDMSNYDSSKCALRAFVRSDGALDGSFIGFNMSQRTGIDVMLPTFYYDASLGLPALSAPSHAGTSSISAVAHHSRVHPASAGAGSAVSAAVEDSHDLQFQMVCLQLKNKKIETLAGIMLTLHPGTQLLREEQRKALVAETPDAFEVPKKKLNGGAGYLDWCDYVNIAAQHPCLATNWIRVPVMSRNISREVYEFARLLSTKGDLGKHKKLWNKEQLESAHISPTVFLSLAAESWLTADIRSSFVNDGHGTMILSPEPSTWVPASLILAARYCKRAGGNFDMPSEWEESS